MATKPQPLSMDLILPKKGGATGAAPDHIVGPDDRLDPTAAPQAIQSRAGEGRQPSAPAPVADGADDAPWRRATEDSGRKVPLNVRIPEDLKDGLSRLVFATRTNNEEVVTWAIRRVLQEWAAAHGVEDWRKVPV